MPNWPLIKKARLASPFRGVDLLTIGRIALMLTILALLGAVPVQGQLDQERIRALGLNISESQHLIVITDVRQRSDVPEFNEVFEKAVDQWCDYFEIARSAADSWRLTCCIIQDPNRLEKFQQAGLFPDHLPPFPAGYQHGNNIWVYAQPGDYYTRHLLIHEGTHAFMQQFLGGYGAAWYAEGIAELLGVHRWENNELQIRHAIGDRDEVPYWGRVKLIRKDRDANNRMTLDEVLEMPGDRFRQVGAYGWAWAACEFLDSHPQFQAVFRRLPGIASQNPDEFNRQFRKAMAEVWDDATTQWEWMIDEIEYGYDVAAAQPTELEPSQLADGVMSMSLRTDRGWQSTTVPVRPGDRLEIAAAGMFRVKMEERPWPCDAGGVTLQYYQGRPLGQLIAAIVSAEGELLDVAAIGVEKTITVRHAGILHLRINESPADWHDNEGDLTIDIRPVR